MSKANDAIAKITKECEGMDYLIPFEEYLTSICTDDHIAEKILDENKTLKGCFDEMKKIAEGRKQGNFAYISPEEGFDIIKKYYEITDSDKPITRGKVIDLADLL